MIGHLPAVEVRVVSSSRIWKLNAVALANGLVSLDDAREELTNIVDFGIKLLLAALLRKRPYSVQLHKNVVSAVSLKDNAGEPSTWQLDDGIVSCRGQKRSRFGHFSSRTEPSLCFKQGPIHE